ASPASVAPQRAASEPVVGPTTDAMLAQYRLAIIAAAKRYKRYPRVALDNNWQGRAQVHMAIGANGTIASMTIRTSSGHDILDRQALDMIRNAIPLTSVPAGLVGKPFAIEIPVVFSLEDPDS
ncbi:MAG: energy transducer TonB, partial [Burkholderiales bacterium]